MNIPFRKRLSKDTLYFIIWELNILIHFPKYMWDSKVTFGQQANQYWKIGNGTEKAFFVLFCFFTFVLSVEA